MIPPRLRGDLGMGYRVTIRRKHGTTMKHTNKGREQKEAKIAKDSDGPRRRSWGAFIMEESRKVLRGGDH